MARLAARPHRDEGMALLMVIGIMAVLSVFLLTSLGLALANAPASRRDQDAKAALAAAEAGVEDYLARLDGNDGYWTLGNTGDPGNLAFGAAGRPIPGTGGVAGSYRYQLVSTPTSTARDGRVRLQVTGTSGPDAARSVSRTVLATLQPKGFLQFIYLSDVEVLDPDLFYSFTSVRYNGQSNWNGNPRYQFVDLGPGVRQACGQYYYAGRSAPSFAVTPSTPVTVWDTGTNTATGTTFSTGTADGFACSNITWFTGDAVQGTVPQQRRAAGQRQPAVHRPEDRVQLAEPAEPGAALVDLRRGRPRRAWAAAASRGTGRCTPTRCSCPAGTPPCAATWSRGRRTRRTRDRAATTPAPPGSSFQGTTMKVLSPGTTNAPARCLVVANRGVEQTLSSIPPVIYVDATSAACGTVGYPAAGEWLGGTTTDYDCHRGTAYVQAPCTDRSPWPAWTTWWSPATW